MSRSLHLKHTGRSPTRTGFTRHGLPPPLLRRDHPRSRGVHRGGQGRGASCSGSSPLARGLLTRGRHGPRARGIIPARAGFLRQRPAWTDHEPGIIPARAGFTAPTTQHPSSSRDHPRSRGVYRVMRKARLCRHGSSPLARGLPLSAWTGPPPTRIIPARAGFTLATRTCPARCWDHPRSRGVYPAVRPSGLSERGSSPLARGLPRCSRLARHLSRIIPARAGFTLQNRSCRLRVGDHPRSRGVYEGVVTAHLVARGSSPLARGLQHVLAETGSLSRIIPARAGFTPWWPWRSCPLGDHPRSRGVYAADMAVKDFDAGSSPLARGLHSLTPRSPTVAGIIPARAGFTLLITTLKNAYKDHPRSRGVYRDRSVSRVAGRGSSPLARGLQRPSHLRVGGARIIPARAGFTLPWTVELSCRRDHPRSRGVYRTSPTGAAARWGSSPLARGLPGVLIISASTVGIIPARAGFTATCARAWKPGADHPRSRGVYEHDIKMMDNADGSSPLARGLRDRRAGHHRRHRIIPARAGFTRIFPCRVTQIGDHPRSRGVYGDDPGCYEPGGGSSPLARGLPHALITPRHSLRIIPARAGFTPIGEKGNSSNRDHPRSRGVYLVTFMRSQESPGSSPLARGLPKYWPLPPQGLGIIPARAGFTRR